MAKKQTDNGFIMQNKTAVNWIIVNALFFKEIGLIWIDLDLPDFLGEIGEKNALFTLNFCFCFRRRSQHPEQKHYKVSYECEGAY